MKNVFLFHYISVFILTACAASFSFAQQLIYNQSFEDVFAEWYPNGSCCYYYAQNSAEYNRINSKTHTHSFTLGLDTFTNNYTNTGCMAFSTKGDTNVCTVGLNRIAVDGKRYLGFRQIKNLGLKPNGHYYAATKCGLSLELKATLDPNSFYLSTFYCYLDTGEGVVQFSPPLRGVNVGVSTVDSIPGNTVAHVFPPPVDYCPNGPFEHYYSWKKYTELFKAPVAAKYLTFVSDDDTTINAWYSLDYCSLYPVKTLGTRTVYLCVGDSIKFSAAQKGMRYEWSTGDTDLYITVKDTGVYWNYIFGTDTVLVDSVHVVYNNISNQREPEKIICKGDSLALLPSVILYQASFLWNTGDTGLQITVNNSGMYWIKSSYSTCIFTDTFYVKIDANPPLQLPTDTVLCKGAILTLDAKNAAYSIYQWDTGITTSSITISSPGKFIVMASDGNCSTKDSVNVSLQDLPVIYLPADTSFCFDDPVIKMINVQQGYLKYSWFPLPDTAYSAVINSPGKYIVLVTNNAGCTNTDSVTITNDCEMKVWVPNVFTPNNDGLNDDFQIHYRNVGSIDLTIYNRLSGEVFHTNSMNEFWNGTYKNDPVPTDVFFWKLTYNNFNGTQSRTDKGVVHLLK